MRMKIYLLVNRISRFFLFLSIFHILVSNGNGLRVETSSTGRIAIVLRVSRVSIRGGMSANDNQQIDILVSPDNIGLPPYILSRNMWQCRVMPRPRLTLWKDNPMRSTVRVSDFAPRP